MKHRPETREAGPYEGVPGAEPGVYTMRIVRWKENVQTKNGIRDVIDFVGDNAHGVSVGATLWIKGPGQTSEGRTVKGNLWQYRKLAEAIGKAAVDQYETTDAEGFSTFNPNDWKTTWLKVTVDEYGVDTVEEADLGAVAAKPSSAETVVAEDDIPF